MKNEAFGLYEKNFWIEKKDDLSKSKILLNRQLILSQNGKSFGANISQKFHFWATLVSKNFLGKGTGSITNYKKETFYGT